MRNDRVKGQSHGFARAFRMVGNRHGAALAIVAISLVVILGMGALAVDMGMLIKQRDDAQRAADAAALAGASAFQNAKPLDAVPEAKKKAFDYLARNYVGGTYIDTAGKSDYINGGNRYIQEANEGTVVVLPDSVKVRVIVRRRAVGTLFASLLGYLNVPIAAKAAAVASNAGASKCLKPFALPDIWGEPGANPTDDKNFNRMEDVGNNWNKPDENWRYTPATTGDHYRGYGDTDGSGDVTGWGSDYRNNFADEDGKRYWDDYGRLIKLKITSAHDVPSPSFFQAWVIPGTGKGAASYRNNIATCNNAEITLATDYEFDDTEDSETSEPGNMVGPTFQGMQDLIGQDPDACWAEEADPNHAGYTRGEVRLMSGGSCSAAYPSWESSPRVITVPLFDPAQIQSGRTSLQFNNLGVFFIEEQEKRKDPIVARFLFFAKGTGSGPTEGSLVKKIRLVE
jgi:Flp pilus assembly protein TadG